MINRYIEQMSEDVVEAANYATRSVRTMNELVHCIKQMQDDIVNLRADNLELRNKLAAMEDMSVVDEGMSKTWLFPSVPAN